MNKLSYQANAAQVENRCRAEHDVTADPEIAHDIAERPRVVDDRVDGERHDEDGDEHVGARERHDERVGDRVQRFGGHHGHNNEQIAHEGSAVDEQ